jgi:hypothetical protein
MKRTTRKPLDPRAAATAEAPKTRAEMIEKTIEDAMRPYLGVLPPEGLKSMRDALEDALTTHPVAVEAFDAMERQAPKQRSGTRVRGEDPRGGDDGGGAA